MSIAVLHWPPLAFAVCARHKRGHFEGIEDPHGHPEHPGDSLLTDYHCPNTLDL